ncbi:CASP7 [Lepeophtheirus salmonis]|uniref:CASP7 n=1 Tax=Lepeophtheirus salmonis TaxID=72036 RepID=A0A7R8D380_LEPSM|nr:CASP7 [Lepeophtheirus salmonis]CAF3009963.1 CASP7 [Lepeophtheirus salmonis]
MFHGLSLIAIGPPLNIASSTKKYIVIRRSVIESCRLRTRHLLLLLAKYVRCLGKSSEYRIIEIAMSSTGDTVERASLPRRIQIMNLNGTDSNSPLKDFSTNGDSNDSDHQNNNDQDDLDAWPGLPGRGSGSNTNGASRFPKERGVAKMPVERDAESYNMMHRKRGIALVFNHENFDPRLELKKRNGTRADRDNLKRTLRKLEFEVRVFDDLDFMDLDKILEDVSNDDHTESDCLLILVLSHGESGLIYARDSAYKPERLWSYFNGKNCPTLAGKPKMILIQACQGDQLDHGVELVNNRTETDSASLGYRMPIYADFLIGYSTMPGFLLLEEHNCWILVCSGSLPILLELFSMHEKKQIPFIASMLTRKIFLLKKLNVPTNVL